MQAINIIRLSPWSCSTIQSNGRTGHLILVEKNSSFLVCHYGNTEILAQTVAGAGLSMFPRDPCFLHLDIFSRWDAETLALCLGPSRLPHLAQASCPECKFHTSGFYTCTGWWHSVCAAVQLFPNLTHTWRSGISGSPWTCAAENMLQEMPHKKGKPA